MLKIPKLFLLVLIALNCTCRSSCKEKHSKDFQWPKIYIYGDSITESAFGKDGGWASILSDAFTRNADIIARGFAGYNTRQCRALLPYLKNDFKDVSIAGIFLGANDANGPKTQPNMAVPVDEYKENLKYMINFMRKFKNIKSLFLITPLALDEDNFRATYKSVQSSYGKTSALVTKYVTACIETANEIGVPYIDVQSAMLQRDDWREFLRDGLHFNANGAEFFASIMLPRLKTFLAENNLGGGEDGFFPFYKNISNDDPNKSIVDWFKSHRYD